MSPDAHGYCPAVLALDPRQLSFLADLPRPAHALVDTLHCELELRHAGSHAALGQHAWEDQWWVQWTLTASEINPLAFCTAERVPGDVEMADNGCVLFAGHAGRHSHAPGQFFA